jgi:hypothetical protein
MTISRCSGLALLLLAGCSNNNPEGDARRLGLASCDAVKGHEERSAEALMTPALQAGIARVRAADAAFRKASPGEKPPLGDGLPLAGFPDTVATCTPTVDAPERVTLAYVPAGDGYGGWRDQLQLERVSGRLLVADILYGPDQRQRFSQWIAANGG